MDEKEKAKQLVARLYKNVHGEPFILTDNQAELFNLIYKKIYPRNHIMTFTQYGKSDIVSMAVLTRVSTFAEPFALVAPTDGKAKIIMNYIIQHTFDNPYTIKRLQIGEGESLERIRRERSKNKLTFKTEEGYGEVSIFSAQAQRTTNVEKALMGFGSPNVIEDESALVPDVIHSTVMRMLGGHKENFLVKIGNPFNRNHFLKSFRNDNYHKFIIDWTQGVKEGRITDEFIDEMRKEAMFDILYECKFPDADKIDERGYMPLLSEKELKTAMVDTEMFHFGQKRIGCDVAGGGKNYSVLALRSRNYAEIIHKDRSSDTMGLTGIAIQKRKEAGLDETRQLADIYVDAIGIGKGVYDRLCEQVPRTVAVIGGAQPMDKEKFVNKRAENYWRLREWILTGGKIKQDKDWYQLLDIKYKIASDKKIKIMSKEEMLKLGIDSPDVADTLANTFNSTEVAPAYQEQSDLGEVKPSDFDPYYQ